MRSEMKVFSNINWNLDHNIFFQFSRLRISNFWYFAFQPCYSRFYLKIIAISVYSDIFENVRRDSESSRLQILIVCAKNRFLAWIMSIFTQNLSIRGFLTEKWDFLQFFGWKFLEISVNSPIFRSNKKRPGRPRNTFKMSHFEKIPETSNASSCRSSVDPDVVHAPAFIAENAQKKKKLSKYMGKKQEKLRKAEEDARRIKNFEVKVRNWT